MQNVSEVPISFAEVRPHDIAERSVPPRRSKVPRASKLPFEAAFEELCRAAHPRGSLERRPPGRDVRVEAPAPDKSLSIASRGYGGSTRGGRGGHGTAEEVGFLKASRP